MNNPKQPYIVKVPNKIRKRITMHEKENTALSSLGQLLIPPVVPAQRKRGSMWSRFTAATKKIWKKIRKGK